MDPAPDADTRKHVGTHPIILERLAANTCFAHFWTETFKKVMQLHAWTSVGECLHISCYCRAGEKRSVAVCAVIQALLRRCGWQVDGVEHLAVWDWRRRRNCCGECADCRSTSLQHPTYNKVHDIWNCLAQDWLQKAAAVGHREEDNYQ